ncbi:MAG: RHS repeat protein [Anaerolineae bacterium]|nr:RHS repeat protein [Anaerolineae bacterium]
MTPTAGAQVTLPLDTGNTQEFYYYNLERPARVLSRQLTSGGVYLESHQLVDGFGRNLQAQVNDTTAGYRLLTSGLMDGLGQTRYASGSYQASGLAGTGYVTPTWASIPTYSAPAYDALGRQVVDEARSFTTTLYSSTLSYQGWKTIATDANGKPSAREADAFGQLITVTEYLSNATISQATTYAYDYQGNLVKLVDALGNTTTITYDLLGRKLGMRDPDMGVWGYQYDGNGNLTVQTDARGQQVQFLFDALNRPIETRDPNASWTLEKRYYDEAGYGLSKGRRTRAEAYVGGALNNTIATTHDARGRVTLDRRSIGGENYDTQASYDSANRALTSTLLTGEVLTPSYNSLGQAYALSGSQGYVNGAFYNYLGKPSEIQLANGLSQLTNYFGVDTPAAFGTSQFGRLRQICVGPTAAGNCYDDQRTGGTTATQLNLVYWFDNLGNLTEMGDRSAGYTVGGSGHTNHTYAYDDLNRLISGSASGGEFPNFSSAWTFDGLGNMTSKAGMVQGYSASGPSSVRPHAVITSSSALDGNYNYDANGNMTTWMDASVTYTQSWDAQNRLGSVTASTKNTAWVYDADGARVSKNDGAITTVYIGGSVEVQISGTLRLTTTYYFFGGARIAMRVGANVTFLHGDRLGSASLATDAAGNVLSQERYYVWGSASMMSGTMPTDFQWQNQRRLDEAQAGRLYDFNARFFMPVTARFISPDSIVPNPADPQSLNRYTAMANNPLRFTDPSGHRDQKHTKAVGELALAVTPTRVVADRAVVARAGVDRVAEAMARAVASFRDRQN